MTCDLQDKDIFRADGASFALSDFGDWYIADFSTDGVITAESVRGTWRVGERQKFSIYAVAGDHVESDPNYGNIKLTVSLEYLGDNRWSISRIVSLVVNGDVLVDPGSDAASSIRRFLGMVEASKRIGMLEPL